MNKEALSIDKDFQDLNKEDNKLFPTKFMHKNRV